MTTTTPTNKSQNQIILPEQMSLTACEHIQNYKKNQDRTELSKEDLNAVLRLSQHLRVFGLLSATGYINQSNDQEGKVRVRTVPVWLALLGQLIFNGDRKIIENKLDNRKKLMTEVQAMAKDRPAEYMMNWRKSLIMANHWNFWARAYAGEE